jgi:uncharacterized protein (DUF1800 family)
MGAATDGVIAVRRFGLGARPGELAAWKEPRDRLRAGLDDPARYALDDRGLPTLQDAVALLEDVKAQKAAPTGTADRDRRRDLLVPDATARFRRALVTSDGFAERLVWFWSNHFTVAATKAQCAPFVGLFERQVVRAHLAGRFEDLLLAAARHAAMSTYLDQARSMGPDSLVGQARSLGLNENLARELLELHTLGVGGGYGQGDVEELARALTGWTVSVPRFAKFVGNAPPGTPVFVPALHQPGARVVLGATYVDGGAEQSEHVLRALAHHPATAQHVATKLVRHFVADVPPPDAVAAVARVFLDTGGDLPAVHAAVVGLDAAWDPEPRKRLTPMEWLVGCLRALDAVPEELTPLLKALALLGQPPFRAPSPAGWPDTAADWGGPDALARRLDVARRLASTFVLPGRPEVVFADVVGPLARPETSLALGRAESAEQAAVLLVMSPELQWR